MKKVSKKLVRKIAKEALSASSVQKASDDSIESWFREFGERMTSSGIPVNATTALQVIAVMACVRVRSQDMAKLPPHIVRIAKNGARTEATDHPLYQIFRRPNSWQSWLEFAEFMQMGILLWGNAYAVVLRNPRGVPIAMLPVNPSRVTVWTAPGGDVFYQVARATLHEIAILADFPLRISSDDVFHLRWAAGGDSLVGISPIGQAAEGIGLAKAQERLASNMMGSGARPSGILTTDKRLSEPVIKRFKAQWDSLHGGVERSGRTAVLEEGLKWQPLTLNSVDLEFINSRKFQVEEICRIFGVNPVKIGVLEGGIGRAFEQLQLAHYSDTVLPDLVRWEQKLEAYFDVPDTMDVTFDETELLRADLAARTNAARVLQVSGIATPNESRAAFDMNPDPDGDQLLVPANMTLLSQLGKLPPPGQPAAAEPGPGSDQTGAEAEGGRGDATELPSLGASLDDDLVPVEAGRRRPFPLGGGNAAAVVRYSDDEPRDDHGRWSDGGGGVTGPSDHGVTSGAAGDTKQADWKKASPHDTVAKLVDAAGKNQKTLGAAGQEIAKETGTTFADPGVKSAVRIEEKLATRGGLAQNITDATRGGFKVSTPQQADEVVQALGKRFAVVDEGWRVTPEGYFDKSLKLKFDDGQVGEIQIWHPALYDAKEPAGHALYVQQRTLSPTDPKYGELQQKMRTLYAKAREQLPQSWKAVLGNAGS